MEYFAICLEGLEPVVKKELDGKKLFNGCLEVKKTKNPKSIRTLCKYITHFKFNSKEDLIRKLNLKFNHKKLAIKSKRVGDHDFNSEFTLQEVIKILKNQKITPCFKDKNTLYIYINKNNCILGYLIKDNLQKREWRIKRANNAVDSNIAYAMIKKAKGIIFDPFCKDAAIPIEADKEKIKSYGYDSNQNNLRNSNINIKFSKSKAKLEKPLEECTIVTRINIIKRINKDKILNELKKSKNIILNTDFPEKITLNDYKKTLTKIKTGKLNTYIMILKK